MIRLHLRILPAFALAFAFAATVAVTGALRPLHAADAAEPAAAEAAKATPLRLPAIFTDHMVLQRDQPLPVWGWAAPGAAVTVTFGDDSQTANADAVTGKWRVTLKAVPANASPASLTVATAAGESLTRSDILVGDVWICSGQSNMQMAVGNSLNAPDEIKAANYPTIRLITVPNRLAPSPQDDFSGAWTVCSPATIPGFSAVGYYFGRHLNDTQHVPIGLINSSWGGTIAEAWVSDSALRGRLPEFNDALDKLVPASDGGSTYAAAVKAFDAKKVELARLEADLDAATAGRAALALDDSAWKTMKTPGNWEAAAPELKTFDGMLWLRKTIDIPVSWAGLDIFLEPGPIDEIDVTWFNGKQVGAAGLYHNSDVSSWDQPRQYRVPGALVKAGPNVVAIRVIDTNGQGGLWGAKADAMRVILADAAGVGDAMALEDAENPAAVSLAGDWRYQVEFDLGQAPPLPSGGGPNYPSVLYNGMIHPLLPYAIKGAIWYQGESNSGRGKQYQTLLPTLIADWRARFGVGDFPFLVVQLANFMRRRDTPAESAWAEVREAQSMTAANDPKVGLGLAIDIGDAADIHPKNKQEVGRRLGLAAQALAYGETLAWSGPVYRPDSMTVADGKATLVFDHANDGLKVHGDELLGFAVRGETGDYVWAQARIDGDKVVVWADTVAVPVAVRYAWADNPAATLYNGADLPAVPFRTDAP